MDDLGFFGEPFFADGPLALAVAAVTSQVVYVSSAGDSSEGHYQKTYDDSFIFHDFGTTAGQSSDVTMDVLIGPGEFIVPILQWNERFGESGADYDIALLDEAELDDLCPDCAGDDFQDGNDDPIESFCYYNDSGSTVRGKIIILRFLGPIKELEMFLLGGFVEEYNVPGDSVFGHAAVVDALAVGAIDASDPGNDDIESFSSLGPSTIFFPSAQTRPKPDLTGIDGVSVTGVGGFVSTFFGTSAAAPHVAGVAALLVESAPTATPARIRNVLTRGAVDLGVSCHDNTFGWGRVDALKAYRRLKPALPWLRLLLD